MMDKSEQSSLDDEDKTVLVSSVLSKSEVEVCHSDHATEVAFNADERTVLSSHKASSPISDYDHLHVGSIIKNRFRLNKRLGEGGMGCVYLAEDKLKLEAKSPDPFVAIKILSGNFKSHPAAFVSLQRETQKSQQLAHPNIITAYDFDRDGDIIYMTMEALRGDDLDQHIYDDRDRPIDIQLATDIVKSLSLGLAYAHSKGVIHSDLKPANIFLTESKTVKILDFGIARAFAVAGSQNSPEDSFDAGDLGALTLSYASCGMLEGSMPSPADDLYALGIIAYQLFTGEHPFNKFTAVEARDKGLTPKRPNNVNRHQWRAISLALRFDCNERIQSVDDFLCIYVGPSRLKQSIFALSVALILGAGYFYYYTNYLVTTQIDFNELSANKQIEFKRQFEQAEVSTRFGDHNAAIFHLNNAFKIHPYNIKVMENLDNITAVYLAEDINNMSDKELSEYGYHINTLLQYEALTDSREIRRLKDRIAKKKSGD